MNGRKIRGFKLNIRIKEVQRRAKKARIDLTAAGLESEAALTKLIDEFAAGSVPSALYYSFPAQGGTLSPVPGLAYSLGLATLGADLDAFIEQAALKTAAQTPVLEIIAATAMEEATSFILGLVEEEAKEERCELSPIQRLTDAAAVKDVLAKLEGHKIGVAVAEDGRFRPVHTTAFSVSWLARSARSKSRA